MNVDKIYTIQPPMEEKVEPTVFFKSVMHLNIILCASIYTIPYNTIYYLNKIKHNTYLGHQHEARQNSKKITN